jgi:Xaa-Pro aminopeptidase
MILSDEPGYYEEGQFGCRIENLVVCTRDEAHPGMLKWVNITIAPYSSKLLKRDLLTPIEVAHINKYHAEVREKLTPLLEGN